MAKGSARSGKICNIKITEALNFDFQTLNAYPYLGYSIRR